MQEREELVSSACHCINLRRAANAVTQFYDWKLAPLGITVNQYSLLSNIRRIQPCSVAELARRVRLERTTLVRNLRILRAEGWVEDDAQPGNRKSRTHLTAAGEEMAERARLRWQEAQADIKAHLGEENLGRLTEMLLALEKLNMEEKA